MTPNNLTFARLVLSAIVFVPLALYKPYGGAAWVMDIALVLFVVATVTDLLDGYIARRYQMQTALGRLLDPFVDKVLICGTFLFFLGPNYIVHGRNVTDLAPWMVSLVLARELLVTSLRGASEASGASFAATIYGKIKMILQSVSVGVAMVTVAHFPGVVWADWLRKIVIWAMVIFTVLSMLAYVTRYIAWSRSVESAGDGRA
jgi:CDP-diacylglycerol--glycerol-3-phosphate 3-phosphatidyltransferase